MTLDELVNSIPKDSFEEYYTTHSLSETVKHFNITEAQSEKLRYWYHLVKYNPQNKFFQLIGNIDETDFKKCFKSCTAKELCEKFNIPNYNQLSHIFAYFHVKSDEGRNKLLVNKGIHSQSEEQKKQNVIKCKQTKLKRHGDANYNNIDKHIETCISKYGVVNAMQNSDIKEKAIQTNLQRYGNRSTAQNEAVKQKSKETRIKNKGSLQASYSEAGIKRRETNLERYGVEEYVVTEDCRKNLAYKKNSKYNNEFAALLDNLNIEYEEEFRLGHYWFDFRIGNIVVEIDPYSTHNTTWSPFPGDPIDSLYHHNKSNCAKDNGYRCIHVWDWDDKKKIVSSLLPKQSVYARKCTLREVNKQECDVFLNTYHFQNTCSGQKVMLGLYYEDELVQVMTFGKPRYNKKYQWELLRLCTRYEYLVIGGAEKLFKYFVNVYRPQSVISYCDNSKFTGNVYTKLGFMPLSNNAPSIHWYRDKDKKHITNNLLMQRGYDQLFGTNYGKGSSNKELMLANNFVCIYDCGQSTFVWRT